MPRWDYLKAYGLTKEDYAVLLHWQGGVCAGCKRKPRRSQRLSVDHDHRTGKVRGLLCGRCNTLIGYLHEDDDLLAALAQYLRHPPAEVVFSTPRRHIDAPDWGDTP